MTSALHARALDAGDAPRPKRWSGEEYDRLVAGGMLDRQRVELIDGAIINMAPMRDEHGIVIRNGTYALMAAYPASRFTVQVQCPLRLANHRPEPDLAVIAVPHQALRRHPDTALLVIEISDTSLDYDRTVKQALYAGAGIGEYWLINLLARTIEVHRDPMRGDDPHYGRVETTGPDDTLPWPGLDSVVAVKDLLP